MFGLNEFLNKGIINIADIASRYYLGNRRGQSFMLKAVSALHQSAKVREQLEQAGTHIPPFLIASIATSCNLHCTGCYARANGGCGESTANEEMSARQWQHIFEEACFKY